MPKMCRLCCFVSFVETKVGDHFLFPLVISIFLSLTCTQELQLWRWEKRYCRLHVTLKTHYVLFLLQVPFIHWSPLSNLEMYAQKSGRAGRDNLPSTAYLLYSNTEMSVETEVKEYALNSATCRRRVLFMNFLFSSLNYQCVGCKWCDGCKTSCSCI